MGTTAQKLSYLNGTKSAIKTAIENKGVQVPSNTTFRDYATKIGQISTGDKKWGVSVDNLWRTSAKATPDLEDLVIPNGECPKVLGEVFQYSGLKSITITDTTSANFGVAQYGNNRVFGNNPDLESVLIDCGNRTSNFGSSGLNYAFVISSLGNPPANPPATFELRTTRINGSSSMTYMFQNNLNFRYFSFPTTTMIGPTSYTPLSYCFYNTNQCYKQDQANINQFRFPMLEQIGGNSTAYYGAFKTSFYSSASSTYHYGELLLPELTTAYCKSSTSSNGHFNSCNALKKVYLPKLTDVGTGTTYSKYLFTGCSNLTEIHFGIENQATVEAMDGYSTKFGATNATLYFDLVNHITVNGVVYDRYGADYDYDNEFYSWKNGNNVIYTRNALTPTQGQEVYSLGTEPYSYEYFGTIEYVA